MSAHSHQIPDGCFGVPANTAVFICDHVASRASPILRVSHDHDGDWQFLCDGYHSESTPVLICLGCTVERDRTVLEVADLPAGWSAERDAVGGAWHREEREEAEE